MDVLNELSACLALVRPAGMTEDMATEWLAVAASTLTGLSEHELDKGFRKARLECSHHSQIVPTVMKANAEAIAYRKQMDALRWDRPAHRDTPSLGYSGAKQIGQVKALQHIEVSDD